MSDTLMTIIGIFLAVLLMFMFPLMEFAGKNDEIAQTTVQVAVSDFVNTVASKGKITQFDYNKLVQKINATGNSYDIQIEAQILDDNPRRATTTASSDMLGEYKYYSVYTNTILEEVNSEQGEYVLKKDDYVVVNVKNTNITMATELKNLFYKIIGNNAYTIGTSASALVLNGGNDKVENGGGMTPNTPTYGERTIAVTTKKMVETTTTVSGNLDLVVILDCESSTMPYHNRDNTSEAFVRNIISGIQGKGNISFILTCDPTTIYRDTNDVRWIYKATTDTTASNYVKAMNTALQEIKGRSGARCIVFLSWNLGNPYLSNAVDTLKRNSSSYDIFFTTNCCGNGSRGGGEQWHNAIGSTKSGGHLMGSDIESKFESLLEQTVTVQEERITTNPSVASSDLKIKLNNLDTTKDINIKINGTNYTVGHNIPEYIVYQENGSYYLDLKILGEILRMPQDDWNTAEIELIYVQI